MPELSRILDKYSDQDICKMNNEDRNDFFSAIAKRGAFEALKSIGLDDKDALADIVSLRDLVKGYRVVKSTVWLQFWKIGVTVVTIWLIMTLFPTEKAKQVISLITG